MNEFLSKGAVTSTIKPQDVLRTAVANKQGHTLFNADATDDWLNHDEAYAGD